MEVHRSEMLSCAKPGSVYVLKRVVVDGAFGGDSTTDVSHASSVNCESAVSLNKPSRMSRSSFAHNIHDNIDVHPLSPLGGHMCCSDFRV